VYRVAGVATTFSPRFLAVLAEARRVSNLFAAPLHFIHAAEETADKNDRFHGALARLGMEMNTPIYYRTGDPVEAILAVQKEIGIEVLIAGALERETVHRNFTGNVARELMRRICADLFLFVEPKDPPAEIRHIFMAVPDFSPLTRSVFHRAVQFGERAGAESLTVVHVQTPFSEAKDRPWVPNRRAPKTTCSRFWRKSRPATCSSIITWSAAIPGLRHLNSSRPQVRTSW
jgi:nucleotide-binding universal stress UspA family protein